jgi:Tfp pilus assembly protein PilN
MRPVNLIPAESRRNTTVAGRSGGGAYVLLATLGLMVVLLTSYTLAGRSVNDKRSELASVRAEADQIQAEADRLKAYQDFAAMRQQRTDTVASLATSRFDWARALRELARTLPTDVSLTGLSGTVTPGVTVENAVSDTLRAALPVPAVSLTGCTRSQSDVARLMSSLRRIDGVERVSVSDSEKADTGGLAASAAAGPNTGDCTGGSDKRPKFTMTVFFTPPPAAAAPTTAAGTTATASTGATP